MGSSICAALAAFGFVISVAASAAAQTPTKPSLSGIVQDAQRSVIPGATVTVVAVADGQVAATTTTNQTGAWEVAFLDPGTYRVLVSLQGFKTIRHDAVVVAADESTHLTTTLQIAQRTIVDYFDPPPSPSLTESRSIDSSDLTKQIPLFRRNAMYVVALSPGINTNPRYALQQATMFGLPPTMTGLYLDGIGIKPAGDGLVANSFATVIRPSIDFLDEAKVGSLPGGDASDRLPASVRFVTRSGSNRPDGSAYAYSRPADDFLLNDFGVRSGGPVVLPDLFDGRGRVFYHLSYEEERSSAPDGRAAEHLFAARLDANITNRHKLSTSVEWQGDRASHADVERATGAFVAETTWNAALTSNIVNEATIGAARAESPVSVARLIEASDTLNWLKGVHSLALGVQTQVSQLGESAQGATAWIQDQWRPRSDLTVDAGIRHAAPHLNLGWRPNPEWGWLHTIVGESYAAELLAGCARLDTPGDGHSCSVGFQRGVSRSSWIYLRYLDVDVPDQRYQLTEVSYRGHWQRAQVSVSYSHQHSRESIDIPANALKGFGVWLIPGGWNASLVGRIEHAPLVDMSVKKIFSLGPRRDIECGVEVFNLTNNDVVSRLVDPSNQLDPSGRVGQLVFRVNW